MALPRYSEDPNTPFLQVLRENGYIGWYVFSSGPEETALWKAIATGLLLHSAYKYPDVHDYLERVWKPKIQSILEADRTYNTQEANQKYSNPEYWRTIGVACMTLAINFFKANGKPQQAEEVQKGKCPDKSNKVAYEAFATHLNLCLLWYECTAERRVITHPFHSKTKNDVSLFINIAQDGDQLYFLYHRGLNESVAIGFPYLMKVHSQGEPLSIGCELRQSESAGDPRDALIENLLKVLEASALLTLAITQEIPAAAGDYFRQFHERVGVAKNIYGAVGSGFPPLMSESVKGLLALKVASQQAGPAKEPHTVQNCEQYPELGHFEEYHGHHFHRDCISQYLTTLHLRYPNLPNCPVPGCQQQLPDTVLDYSPSVRSHYEANKAAVRTHKTQEKMDYFSNFTLPPQNIPISCTTCTRSLAKQYFMSHGCQVCVICAYTAYSQSGQCPLCKCAFSAIELEVLSTYYNETYGGGVRA